MIENNVIQFPKAHREEVEDQATIELALDVFEEVAGFLDEEGYNIEEMNNDLGVLVNLLVACLYRQQDKEHFLHDALDSIYRGLEEIMKSVGEEAPSNDSD